MFVINVDIWFLSNVLFFCFQDSGLCLFIFRTFLFTLFFVLFLSVYVWLILGSFVRSFVRPSILSSVDRSVDRPFIRLFVPIVRSFVPFDGLFVGPSFRSFICSFVYVTNELSVIYLIPRYFVLYLRLCMW